MATSISTINAARPASFSLSAPAIRSQLLLLAGDMATPNENFEDGKAAGERVAKVIARSGLCSRREAEALIEEKRVSVNGALIESAALDVLSSDTVLVDGKPLSAREPPRLWRYHKPKGRVTTHKDPEGRPTVFEALPEGLPRLISVGRLDFNTEGLLLLTNDGDLARHLELPSTGWTRRYRVRAYGQVSEAQLQELAGGLIINRMSYGPIEASLEREQGDNVWISISIREGKNREVRRIMEHLGLTVNRLIRISFGPFMLGELETGEVEEVKTAVLKDQLGPRLSRQLGVRREPMREERKLAPGRGKPTYLRRKPAAEEWRRPEPEAGPLKRRRVLTMDGSEAPKVEFVSEKKPRFDRKDGRAERPNREGRDERPQARREGETRRNGDYAAERPKFADKERSRSDRNFSQDRAGPASFRKRPETGKSERPRFERKERGSSYGAEPERTAPSGGGPKPFAPRLDAITEGPDVQRTFRSKGPRREFEDRKPRERTGERPRPQFRRDAEGPRGASEDRKPRERIGERPRPQFRRDAEGARSASKDCKPPERTGERPRTQFRRDAEGPRSASEDRKPRERTGERPRPQFRRDAEGPRGASEDRKPRERTGERPRSQFRRDAEGPRGASEDRKPRERSFDRSGGSRPPAKRGAGKPFRSGAKPPHGPGGSLRKPRPRPAPGKETP